MLVVGRKVHLVRNDVPGAAGHSQGRAQAEGRLIGPADILPISIPLPCNMLPPYYVIASSHVVHNRQPFLIIIFVKLQFV